MGRPTTACQPCRSHPPGRATPFELFEEPDPKELALPVAPEQLPGRRARAGTGDRSVRQHRRFPCRCRGGDNSPAACVTTRPPGTPYFFSSWLEHLGNRDARQSPWISLRSSAVGPIVPSFAYDWTLVDRVHRCDAAVRRRSGDDELRLRKQPSFMVRFGRQHTILCKDWALTAQLNAVDTDFVRIGPANFADGFREDPALV